MQLFQRRPLALACLVFLLGLGLGYVLFEGGDILLPFIIVALLVGLTLAFVSLDRARRRLSARRWISSALIACFLAGGLALSYGYFGVSVRRAEAYLGAGDFAVTVETITYQTDYGTYGIGYLTDADGRRIGVRISADAELAAGDRVFGTGTALPFEEFDYDFAEKSYYLSHGVLLDVELDTVHSVTPGHENALSALLTRWNRRLRAILQVNLAPDAFGLLSALVLGNREDLAPDTKRDFSELGLAHVLALSGMHLAVICGLFERLLAGVGRRPRYLFLIALALLYAGMTGLSPSVCRAALMLSVTYVLALLGYRRDSLTVLLLVGVGMCLLEPYLIVNAAFLLSFLATLACTGSGRAIRLPRRLRERMSPLLVTGVYLLWMGVFVCMLTLPISALISSRACLLTPVTSLLFSLPTSLLLILAPILLLLHPISLLCHPLAAVTEAVARLVMLMARELAPWQPFTLSTVSRAKLPLILLLAAVLFLLLTMGRKTRRILCFSALALYFAVFGAAGLEGYLTREATVLTAISYKKNDLFTLRHEGADYILDVSDGSLSAVSKSYRSLLADGERRIDAWILTHYHQRHLRALDHMAREMFLSVLCLPEPESEAEASLFAALTDTAQALGVQVVTYRRDAHTSLVLGDLTLTAPPYELLSRSTHPVLSFSLHTGNTRLTYLGASVNEVKTNPASEAFARGDILYLGSHGPIQKKPWTERAVGAVFATAHAAEFYEGSLVTVAKKLTLVLE